MSDVHRACLYGTAGFVEILLACNAKVNDVDILKMTPLMMSVQNESHEEAIQIVSLLVSRGAEVNQQDISGCTALHHAVIAGNHQAVDFLIRNHANPFILNFTGYSALGFALSSVSTTPANFYSYRDRVQICRTLIKRTNTFETLKRTILVTRGGNNVCSLFDYILFCKRENEERLLRIGWDIFNTLCMNKINDFYLHKLAHYILKENKNNFDVLYFFENMNIDDVEQLLIAYFSRFSYEANFQRVNLLVYYLLAISHLNFFNRMINEKMSHPAIQRNVFMLQTILTLRNKIPFSLKFFCRILIRKNLKYSMRGKLDFIDIPHDLKEYLLLSETKALVCSYNFDKSFKLLLKLIEKL